MPSARLQINAIPLECSPKKELDNRAAEPVGSRPLDMKNSPLSSILLVVLAMFALSSVVLCGYYIHYARDLRALQGKAESVNYQQALIQALANDVVEYSKKNPAIDPILESVNLKPKSGTATNNSKPAGK
jgi:hypothetical protein